MVYHSFTKVQGGGNDFILFDCDQDSFPLECVPLLCDRRFGIGADGVILLKPSVVATCRMEVFNADASRAALCGNALRCVARFLDRERAAVETDAGIFSCVRTEGGIRAQMPWPRVLHWPLQTDYGPLYVASVGVPHAVLFVQETEVVPLSDWGPVLRLHPALSSEGANINVASVSSDGKVKMRTYERGVEGETLACGTGVVAVAWTCAQLFDCPYPMALETRSAAFIVRSSGDGMEVEGPAQCVFVGELYRS